MHIPSPLLLLFSLFIPSSRAQGTTITVAASPQPTGASASYTSDATFQHDMVTAHNFFRRAHNASDLAWNDTSARFAARWADGCVFEHSGGPTGENLAQGYPNATSAVDAWALERADYSWSRPGFDHKTGHFTQLVWRNTTSVGCGRANCELQGWLVVCEYYPPGNVLGPDGDTRYFKDNVLPQIQGAKTDTVESGVTSAGAGWSDVRWGLGIAIAAGTAVLGIGW